MNVYLQLPVVYINICISVSADEYVCVFNGIVLLGKGGRVEVYVYVCE